MKTRLLEIENLSLTVRKSHLNLLDHISFYMNRAETVGIVGESGCGKSMTALSIMRLNSSDEFRTEGNIRFKGKELLHINKKEIMKICGKDISMIFQEPIASLNPVISIGDQIAEMILLHNNCSKKEARKLAVEQLKIVAIPDPEEMFEAYPHQLSGGMCQRIMIAMAMVNHPQLLIADEPTTALDVTIQAQILELMNSLKTEYNMGILLITHDLGVVAEMCDRIIVMYAGHIVEEGTVEEIFSNPKHPYTIGLLESIPQLNQKRKYLTMIPGVVPPPNEYEKELCRFKDRCEYKNAVCEEQKPCMNYISDTHVVNCHLPGRED